MKRIILLLGTTLFVWCGGCSTQHSWVYSPNKYGEVKVASNKTATILPFNDDRPNLNSNKILLYLIPLVPFGSANYTVPEGSTMHINSSLWTNYKPNEDFPKALSEELRNSKIFKEAYFDFKKGNSDILIIGKIISTEYNGKIISYGLSAYGPILWFIGFPATTVSNELIIELSCLDAKTDKVLFSKTYTANPYDKVGWIYSLPIDFNYPTMLQQIYKEFVGDIKNSFQDQLVSAIGNQ